MNYYTVFLECYHWNKWAGSWKQTEVGDGTEKDGWEVLSQDIPIRNCCRQDWAEGDTDSQGGYS